MKIKKFDDYIELRMGCRDFEILCDMLIKNVYPYKKCRWEKEYIESLYRKLIMLYYRKDLMKCFLLKKDELKIIFELLENDNFRMFFVKDRWECFFDMDWFIVHDL